MLAISRKCGQKTILDLGDGRVVVIDIAKARGGYARLAIDAPPSVKVWRSELLEENRQDLLPLSPRGGNDEPRTA